jgi:hypothetical protein
MTRAATTSMSTDARTEGIRAIEVSWNVTPSAIGATPRAGRARITLHIDTRNRTAIATTGAGASDETERWRTEFHDIRVLRTSACLHVRIPGLLELVLVNDQSADGPSAPLYIRTDVPERLGLEGGRYDAPRVRLETDDV